MTLQEIALRWLDLPFSPTHDFPFFAVVIEGEEEHLITNKHIFLSKVSDLTKSIHLAVLDAEFVDELHTLVTNYPAIHLEIGWLEKPFSLPYVALEDEDLRARLALNVFRFRWIQTYQKPYITLSFGMSLDGKIATYTGDSKYISGIETRQFVHDLRHRYDAILIGIQTVKMDHPSLTTRRDHQPNKDAERFILDSTLSIQEEEPILSLESTAKTHILCKADVDQEKVNRLRQRGVEVHLDSSSGMRISLSWLVSVLQQLGCWSLLVEGGGTVHFSFIQEGLFNDIYAQISPLILGGKDAKTPVEGQGFAMLKDAKHVAFNKYFIRGRDIVVYARNLARE